ncbi:MAG: hypothetical protein AAGH15_13655 [Myxococcota bacterium]
MEDLSLDTVKTGLAMLGGVVLSARGFLQFLAPLTKWKGDDKVLAFLDSALGWLAVGGAPKR